MPKEKLYFTQEEDGEYCFPLAYFEERLVIEELDEIKLWEAKKQDGIDEFFWCKHYSEIMEKGEDSCGKHCEAYAPRNGKSGRCKHHSTDFYEATDNVYLLKKDKSLTKIG